MAQNPQDFTYPNNDRRTAMQKPNQQSSPLMGQLKDVWGLPWANKPIPKGKSASKGMKAKSGGKMGRSGSKMGKMKKSSGWY